MAHLRKAFYFWPIALTVFLSDCATKSLAETHLPLDTPRQVLGDFLRFTLVYNQSAAMSVDLGSNSRILLSVVAFVALMAIYAWYRRTPSKTVPTILGLALVWAGAAGNLWDRVRSDRGVVDFIDFGVRGWRFWVFNVADVAIFLGAFALFFGLLRTEDDAQAI